jgi:hypothetical protein
VADAKFDSERIYAHVLPYPWRTRRIEADISATAIPAPRSDPESVQFGETLTLGGAPGRKLPMQKRQALLLGLSFNHWHRSCFSRMSTEPRHLCVFEISGTVQMSKR